MRLSAPKKDDTVSMDFEPLDISGSGMSLAAKERFKKGDLLEIRVVLQTYPAKVLHLYGKVVRVEATPNKFGGYITGIQFVGLSETVRDEILKFDFKKHRERLIAKRS
jgi:c-di-GMP-binding flagellar brake protein YcgR